MTAGFLFPYKPIPYRPTAPIGAIKCRPGTTRHHVAAARPPLTTAGATRLIASSPPARRFAAGSAWRPCGSVIVRWTFPFWTKADCRFWTHTIPAASWAAWSIAGSRIASFAAPCVSTRPRPGFMPRPWSHVANLPAYPATPQLRDGPMKMATQSPTTNSTIRILRLGAMATPRVSRRGAGC
jgi:hypothetical protein